MKKSRVLLVGVIVITVALSWIQYLAEATSTTSEYKENLASADQWVEEGLYDRAIEKYELVLEYDSKIDTWEKLLNAYKLRSYETSVYGHEAIEDYISKLSEAVNTIEDNVNYAMELADLLIEEREYERAYDILQKIKENGIKSDALDSKIEELKYIYTLQMTKVTEFFPYSNGTYSAFNGVLWGEIGSDGDVLHEFEYDYISPTSSEGIRIISKEHESRLYDSENKVLGIFEFEVKASGIYSEELIAVKNNKKYAYYDSFAKKKFGDYDFAGSFTDGVAAVCKDGKWGMIDTEGKVAKKFEYDDIVLDQQGRYIVQGVIAVCKAGKYSLCNKKFDRIGDFTCDEIGIPAQDAIYAFKKDNKWGFVDNKGNEIIKPEYEEAKSFSNGLAAVCKDGKWGFITKENKVVIDFQFEDADYFTEMGICMVKCEDAYAESGYVWKPLKLELGIK